MYFSQIVLAVEGLGEAAIVLDGELRVQGKPNGRITLAAAARQLDREFDLTVARTEGDVALELGRRQHLLEQSAELHLAPSPARLDVAHHAFQVADAFGQLPHLAQ